MDPNIYGFDDPNQYATNWDFYQQQQQHHEDQLAGFSIDTREAQGASSSSSDSSLEDTDFSETVKFIGQVLMEENVEQSPFFDSLTLQVTEKSFYNALTQNSPLSPNQHPLSLHSNTNSANNSSDENNSSRDLKPPSPNPDTPVSSSVSGDFTLHFNTVDTFSQPLPSVHNIGHEMFDLDSSITKLLAQNIFNDADSVSQFKRGFEEASKFLPPGPQLFTSLEPKQGEPLPLHDVDVPNSNTIVSGGGYLWLELDQPKQQEPLPHHDVSLFASNRIVSREGYSWLDQKRLEEPLPHHDVNFSASNGIASSGGYLWLDKNKREEPALPQHDVNISSLNSRGRYLSLDPKKQEEPLSYHDVDPLGSNKIASRGRYLWMDQEKREEPFKEISFGLKGRKNHEREETEAREEWRSNKHSAISSVDESELSEVFDNVLLSVENMPLCKDHDCLQNGQVKQEHVKPVPSNGGKVRGKKQGKKKETIDLRNLLLLCSQAVYANDNRTANELLKQIRQHSSAIGDASQRLAHYFANGLEARLVGDGSSALGVFSSISSKRITAAAFLQAYQLLFSASPFKKFAHFFANKMIMKTAAKAETLHIIDFGIFYGFQWPILIKFLSNREGGPPKLRITGIEFPQPGFHPTEKIEETGRRLANYCKRFNVPFEYNFIASRNWETIPVEDLKINSNEFVAVNCLIRFDNLLDETIEVSSPRNTVLHLIRKINPDIFVQSIKNGSYNSPFFATRFREALFSFSAMYDMCDTVMPRENEWRMMIEKEIFGREAMNVIACEGFERVERPETYKQWQVRNTRAGFKQLPLDVDLMSKLRTKFREWYHRDFVLDEDNNWTLQGWKGRILYASTCWVPA